MLDELTLRPESAYELAAYDMEYNNAYCRRQSYRPIAICSLQLVLSLVDFKVKVWNLYKNDMQLFQINTIFVISVYFTVAVCHTDAFWKVSFCRYGK